MALKDDLTKEVKEIFATRWSTRDGNVVPEAENLKLGNDAVKFDEATVLYADMAGSTELVNTQLDWFAAEVYKAYLHCASKIIRDHNGSITAFDGDRIMAIFVGDTKNTSAAKCALKINYAVLNIINPAIPADKKYTLKHGVGIDMSKMFIARTGVRGSNDLVWVGRAANYAAKLCTIREENYASWITKEVYDRLHDEAKTGGNPKRSMWEERFWSKINMTVYRSSWHWEP